MIFAKKNEGDPPSWSLRINDHNTDDIIVYDDNIALKIVTLWNQNERNLQIQQENLEALDRIPGP